ncbi:hypothetical protein F4781DRAFT_440832 [Annulohypoxylon bovei var. microspora]|nr:hypothetical protein F4781DRAFT_440832 [Annulohypoxylon bovei var. microspora]
MTLHELDSEGDVLLTLHNPTAPFAVWTESDTSPPENEPSASGDTEPNGPSPVVEYLLSSRHLILASEYFRRTLRGPWKEGTVVHSDGRYHISAEDWDETSMLTLMQIIHGRNREVPRWLNYEMIAKIAVLVDYYGCHEAVEIWSDIWIVEPEFVLRRICDRECILMILITSIFKRESLFSMATNIALNNGTRHLPTLNLPILTKAAEKVNQRREEYLTKIFDYLYGLRILSSDDSIGCSFECSSMLLGALIVQMNQHGLLDSKPESPYAGHSIVSIMEMIRKLKTPEWSNTQRDKKEWNQHWNDMPMPQKRVKLDTKYPEYHECSLSDLFNKNLNIWVEGLSLKDI